MDLRAFIEKVWDEGKAHYRDLPWRNIDDAYGVLISEIMLQQTQVKRVLGRWETWLEMFPSVQDLAAAPLQVVLEQWQGMGYNRRAVNMKCMAEAVCADHGGIIPNERKALLALPGIGPATAAGVRVFAFQEPDIYLETNVRTVFIHELFRESDAVSDKELIPLVEQACKKAEDVRAWNYALLDYGAYLKSILPNPSRRSKHYTRQSTFEGSHRQKRAFLLRCILAGSSSLEELCKQLEDFENDKGLTTSSPGDTAIILEELERDAFIEQHEGHWMVKES